MQPALLVIDVQKQFFAEGPQTAQSLTAAIPYINAAIAFFRKKAWPVVCVQHIEEELQPDTPGFAAAAELALLDSDLHIHKTYGNAFNKTPLAEHLRVWNVDTLILTGYCAEYCVLATYRGAQDLDLTPILLRGALASDVPENIGFVERISAVISYTALQKLLA